MFLGISKWFYISAFLLAIFFILVPQIDLMISSLFYTQTEGFFWSDTLVIHILYNIPKFIVVASIILLIFLIIDLIFKKELFGIRALLLFYLVTVMLIGPGLLVNSLFKDHWGRARPITITQFDGTKTFTPAFVISDQCDKNCSFVSGHSAGAYGLIALALLAKRRRTVAIASAITLGSMVGLGRIIQGGHFFSDVLFSFVFVYVTAKILYYFTFEKQLFNFIDQRCRS